MQRLLPVICALAASVTAVRGTAAMAAGQQSPAPSAFKVHASDAPADEYFGPFKYSALALRTKIVALGRSYRERWADDASLVHDAGLLESSFRAWAAKYPKDRWLAPTAFHLAQLYAEIQTDDARNHARMWFRYVATTYPASKEARLARLRLQQGFPPFRPETAVNQTPSPYGSPPASPAAAVAPSTTAVPSPAVVPGAAASPAASASPLGSPSAVPRGSPSPSPRASPRS